MRVLVEPEPAKRSPAALATRPLERAFRILMSDSRSDNRVTLGYELRSTATSSQTSGCPLEGPIRFEKRSSSRFEELQAIPISIPNLRTEADPPR